MAMKSDADCLRRPAAARGPFPDLESEIAVGRKDFR